MRNVDIRLALLYVGSVVIGLMFTGLSFAEVNPENIIGGWFFDEGRGDEVKDSYGDNDGTFVGEGLEWVDGKFNGALQITAPDYVDLGKDEELEANATKTVTFWVKIGAKTDQVIVGNEQSGWNGWWVQLGFQGGHSKVGFLSQSQVDQSTGEVPLDEWTHIATVADYDKGEIRFYINGDLDSTVNRDIRITPSALNMVIGCDNNNGTNRRPFSGVIDELMIFDVVLSENDIKDIMSGVTAVDYAGKLSTKWAAIKTQY